METTSKPTIELANGVAEYTGLVGVDYSAGGQTYQVLYLTGIRAGKKSWVPFPPKKEVARG